MKTLQMRLDLYRHKINMFCVGLEQEATLRKKLDERSRAWKYYNAIAIDLKEYLKQVEVEISKLEYVEIKE